MKALDIINIWLLEPPLELKLDNGAYVDLHGESICLDWVHNENKRTLCLVNERVGLIKIKFKNYRCLTQKGTFSNGCTPNWFYKGQYVKQDQPIEVDDGRNKLYYLHFVDEDFSEVLSARRVTLNFEQFIIN